MNLGIEKIAYLNWTLRTKCPFCNKDIYLEDQDEDGMYSIHIFNNEWGKLKDEIVHCYKCNNEFILKKVVY